MLEQGGGQRHLGVARVVVAEDGRAGGGREESEGARGLVGGGLVLSRVCVWWVWLVGEVGYACTHVGFELLGLGHFGIPGSGVEDPLRDDRLIGGFCVRHFGNRPYLRMYV